MEVAAGRTLCPCVFYATAVCANGRLPLRRRAKKYGLTAGSTCFPKAKARGSRRCRLACRNVTLSTLSHQSKVLCTTTALLPVKNGDNIPRKEKKRKRPQPVTPRQQCKKAKMWGLGRKLLFCLSPATLKFTGEDSSVQPPLPHIQLSSYPSTSSASQRRKKARPAVRAAAPRLWTSPRMVRGSSPAAASSQQWPMSHVSIMAGSISA